MQFHTNRRRSNQNFFSLFGLDLLWCEPTFEVDRNIATAGCWLPSGIKIRLRKIYSKLRVPIFFPFILIFFSFPRFSISGNQFELLLDRISPPFRMHPPGSNVPWFYTATDSAILWFIAFADEVFQAGDKLMPAARPMMWQISVMWCQSSPLYIFIGWWERWWGGRRTLLGAIN